MKDRKRRLEIIFIPLIAVLVLSWFGWYSYQKQNRELKDLRYKINHISELAGQEITLSYSYAREIKSDTVRIYSWNVGEAYFIIPGNHFKKDNVYTVKGIMQADGTVKATAYQHHPHRKFKYLLSLLSLPLILILLFKHLRFDKQKMRFYITG